MIFKSFPLILTLCTFTSLNILCSAKVSFKKKQKIVRGISQFALSEDMLESKNQKTKKMNLILLGDSGVGKSYFTNMLLGINRQTQSTIGLNYTYLKRNTHKYKVNVTLFEFNQIFCKMYYDCIKRADGFIILTDDINLESIERWERLINSHSSAPVLILHHIPGNKNSFERDDGSLIKTPTENKLIYLDLKLKNQVENALHQSILLVLRRRNIAKLGKQLLHKSLK